MELCGDKQNKLAKYCPPLKVYLQESPPAKRFSLKDTSKYKLEQQGKTEANQADFHGGNLSAGGSPNHDIA